MTKMQIDELVRNIGQSSHCSDIRLIETHISWVILACNDVYKIKKPIQLHFLDFSTLKKRKFYCEKELLLNKRLTDEIYLHVLPVSQSSDGPIIGRKRGEIIDYAVHMRRMEDDKRMDLLLQRSAITLDDIDKLAEKIASFHETAGIVIKKDPMDISIKFADLAAEQPYLHYNIVSSIQRSEAFSIVHRKRLEERIRQGLFRDCHGDLHTGNIFLLETPEPFDCVEFNDDIRQIDVLNDIAFLCMDLEAYGRADLAERFVTTYGSFFPAFQTAEDDLLFAYYKSYRANIRAKIASIRARTVTSPAASDAALAETKKYLTLMDAYLCRLNLSAPSPPNPI